jgi:hypothetical protein
MEFVFLKENYDIYADVITTRLNKAGKCRTLIEVITKQEMLLLYCRSKPCYWSRAGAEGSEMTRTDGQDQL